jgi:hypothetical protein
MKEGEAYTIRDGAVVFSIPPPIGVTVAFSAIDAQKTAKPGRACTVIYPDGSVVEISEDPVALLAEAKKERDEAKKLLKEAITENQKTEIVVASYTKLAREKLSGRLEKYAELVDDSVKQAAALARDDVNDHVNRRLIEIRNRHKDVMDARRDVAAIASDARIKMIEAAEGAADHVLAKCREALDAFREIERVRQDVNHLASEARVAASAVGAEISNVFGTRADVVIGEIRSLKNTLDNEVKSVADSARREMESALGEMRAHRAESVRAVKHMNRIERFTVEKYEEIGKIAGDISQVSRSENGGK